MCVSEHLLFAYQAVWVLKKQGFRQRINCNQMKLPNFGSPSSDSSSKIGCHFSNNVVLKLKSAKNAFYKKDAAVPFLQL